MLKKLSIVFILVFSIVIALFLLICNDQKPIKTYKIPYTGKILFKGDAISGSEDMYWSYDVNSSQLLKLSDPTSIKILELRYYLNLPTNRDEKFVVHKTSFLKDQINFLYLPSLIQGIFTKKNQNSELNKYIDASNMLETEEYKIKMDENNRKIFVINKKKGLKSILTFKNYIFGAILSPDSKYLAFFLNDPTSFRDGSVYDIVVLNLDTLRLDKLPNLEVSMPGAMIWVRG